MKIYRNIILSRNTLLTHKIRTFLALLGITIGVAAVIIMVAAGNGARGETMNKIEEMGTNLLVVRAGRTKKVVGRQRQVGDVDTLVMKDYEAISRECPAVVRAAPGQMRALRLKYGNISTMTTVLGSMPDFPIVRNFSMANGRFFNQMENKAARRVVVLGSSIKEGLFENEDPIGEMIRIANIPFEVVGVMKSKGVTADGTDEDNRVLIPINTALRRVFNLDYITNIFVQVKDRGFMDEAEAGIRVLLRERHRLDKKDRPDDFTILNQLKVLEAAEETAQAFTLLIAGIAAISLFVGGVGIMGVMLLAVKERTNEIGLRMAAGARAKDIMAQFLSEAAILGFAGCAAGVLLGMAGAWGAGLITQWQTVVSPVSIVMALLFSLPVGIFFGLYPARKASLLNPIDALRAE